MVATDRTDTIFGRRAIHVSDLSADEKLTVVRDTLYDVASDIRFFPNGKAISQWIRIPRTVGNSRLTAEDIVVLPEALNHNTRLLELAFLGDDENPGVSGHRDYLTEWVLMLTRNGELLLWTSHYEVRTSLVSDKRSVEVARASEFTLLDDQALSGLLEHHPMLTRDIVSRLFEYARKAVSEREKSLRGVTEAKEHLGRIKSRLVRA